MPIGDDEARASAYRQQAARRQANRRAIAARMSGSPSAAAHIRDNFRAITDPQPDDVEGVTDDGGDEPITVIANA